MPIIDGYDEVEVSTGGFKDFAAGNHMATIKRALYEDKVHNGTRKASLIIDVEGDHGETGRAYISIPLSSEQWASWGPKPGKKSGLRNLVKTQLVRLGIHMSEVESDTARGALIGKRVPIEVSKSGQYTNILFRDATSMDAGTTLPAPSFTTGAVVATETRAGEPVIV